MKSLMLLLHCVVHDMGTLCCVSTIRDQKTITDRVKDEGLSFLTITLPEYAKDFERALSQGRIDHTLFRSHAFQRGLPRLFKGFLGLVFDPDTGIILDEPDENAIFAIRQISLACGKIKLPCRDDRVAAAFSKFIECELDVIRSTGNFFRNEQLVADFERFSTLLFGEMFDDLEKQVAWLFPKHGPGSTAERLTSNGKYRQKEWTSRLEEVFPYKRFLSSSLDLSEDRLSAVNIREPWEERPVRVIAVPKTLKTPRIIAIEPTCMQYMQQGVLELMNGWINSSNKLRPLLSNTDQTPNQEMAREGSITGDLATLDLSDASDRVSNPQVRLLLSRWPYLDQVVQAVRSRKADVPGHGVIHLAKFASMGSALTFVIEAMVFLTVVFIGIERGRGYQFAPGDVKRYRGRVRVYGDDIIVPTEYARSVIETLEVFGFKVNQNKSFWNGKFRESCGKEYYNGCDVSITRIRSMLPSSRKDVDELISTVSLRNHFYKGGLWTAVRYLDGLLEGLIPFPAVGENSPCLGRYSFLGYQTEKMHSELQMPLVKAAVASHRIPVDRLDDYGALLKFFLKREVPEGESFSDEKHLERSGRPEFVDIKTRWVSAY